MKKVLKLGLTCMIMLSIVTVIFNRSYAAESSDILNIENIIPEIGESNDSTQQTNTSSNTNSDSTNSTSNSDIPEIPSEPTTQTTPTTPTTPTTQTTQTTQTTPKTEPEHIEDEKLPQTGERENYMLIVAAVAFGGIAVYAYRKNKKYNV